ncbi:MAG: 5'/3'-nucleotidase SurE [Planctomycetes bacterium]|nr:5'/3'-nucleotidase SurE [Planctomycetota bacterium]
MRILLTNDDGVGADSLWAIANELESLGELLIVAPQKQQSGMGHAITYRTPISAEIIRRNGNKTAYAVSGTPADCVKFGLLELVEQPPDLIVSGINLGLNVGCNVFYSGTLAAAIEGALYQTPSFAVSVPFEAGEELAEYAQQALRTIKYVHANSVIPDQPIAWNVNLPLLDEPEPEIVFTHHWTGAFHERYIRSESEEGDLFQLDLPWEEQNIPGNGCDVHVLQDGKISVTPMRPSLTDHDFLRELGIVEKEGSE